MGALKESFNQRRVVSAERRGPCGAGQVDAREPREVIFEEKHRRVARSSRYTRAVCARRCTRPTLRFTKFWPPSWASTRLRPKTSSGRSYRVSSTSCATNDRPLALELSEENMDAHKRLSVFPIFKTAFRLKWSVVHDVAGSKDHNQ